MPQADISHHEARGTWEGANFSLRPRKIKRGKQTETQTQTSLAAPDLNGIELRARSTGLFSSSPHTTLRTGDPAFDEHVELHSPHGSAQLAALDAETRSLLRRAVAQGVSLSRGMFQHDRTGLYERVEQVEGSLTFLSLIARSLRIHGQVFERLSQIIATDPVPEVRANAIDALARHEPDHPNLTAWLVAALDDIQPVVKLTAARHLLTRDPSRCMTALLQIIERFPESPPYLHALHLVAQLDSGHEVLRANLVPLQAALRQEEARAVVAAHTLGLFAHGEVIFALTPLTRGLTTPATLKAAAREAIARIEGRAGERGSLELIDGSSHVGGLELSDHDVAHSEVSAAQAAAQRKH